MAEIQRIGNVFYKVKDMDRAVRFYGEVLGLKVKLRDGDNWTAFDVGGATFALEGGAGGSNGGATVSFRVDDLDGVVAALRAAKANVEEPVAGPHERKATVHDPDGNAFLLYAPLPR